MKLTAEDFRAQYSAMSDDELLAMDPAELQDLARKCFVSEMTRRSLAKSEVVEPDETEIAMEASSPELIPLITFVSLDASKTAYAALKDANVAVVVEETPDGSCLKVPAAQQHAAYVALSILEEAATDLVQQWLQNTLRGRAIMIEDMLAEDDLVAARLTIDGKHQAFCFARIAEGAIAETWHNFDQLRLK